MPEKKESLFNAIWNYLQKYWNGWQGKQKNYFLLILLLLGILLMFAGSLFNTAPKHSLPADKPPENAGDYSYRQQIQPGYEKELTDQLTAILEQIDGISNVQVLVTFDTGGEAIYARVTDESVRETTEKDREGGTRDIVENNRREEYVILREGGGGERPVLLLEKKPQVEGVLVVAQGAENAGLRLKVVRAIESLMGLPAHRIAVLPWGESNGK